MSDKNILPSVRYCGDNDIVTIYFIGGAQDGRSLEFPRAFLRHELVLPVLRIPIVSHWDCKCIPDDDVFDKETYVMEDYDMFDDTYLYRAQA